MENQNVYIPQIDGKDLWLACYSDCKANGYTLLDNNAHPNKKRYKATFDYSLDLIKLRDVYLKVYRNNRFTFIPETPFANHEYCSHIINVTFEYSVKEYNRTGDNIYLMVGHDLKNVLWRDCLGYYEENIIAVKTNTFVEIPLENLLPKGFYYKDRCYMAKSSIKVIKTVAQIRKELYDKGFICDGVKYIRWKRSSGSARVGKCLFIMGQFLLVVSKLTA